MEKLFIWALGIFLWIFSAVWIFNHINSWFGIAVYVLGFYISLKLILKTKKKNEENF